MSFFQKNKTIIIAGCTVVAAIAGVVVFIGTRKKQTPQAEKASQNQQKSQQISQETNQKEIQIEQNDNTKAEDTEEIVNVYSQVHENREEKQIKSAIPATESPIDIAAHSQQLSFKTKTSATSGGRVKVQFLDGSEYFDLATITAILESSLDYVGEEFITLTHQNREDRRKVRLADPDRYKELVLEYNGEIEKLMLAAEDKLLAEVNIDKEQFDESYNSLVQNGYYQQLYMVKSAIRQKISDKLPKTQVVTKETMKDIIRFQLNAFTNQQEQFINIVNQLSFVPDIAELIPYVIGTIIQDMIFEEFAVEEEDQNAAMTPQDIVEDPEVHSLLGQIEEAMNGLMSQLGLNYIDEEQEIAEIERLREKGQYSEK